MLSRRSLFSMAGYGALLRAQVTAVPSPLDRLSAAYRPLSVDARERRYRADAVVSFLGLTIFSRQGVGSGVLTLERGDAASGARTVGLRFAAGSAPERTRGLNRLGYIQEFVVERDAAPFESAYFGFMTFSPEKSLDQAKGALGPAGKDGVPYAAVEGTANRTAASYTLYHTPLPATYTYAKCDEVIRRVREALARKEIPSTRSERKPDTSATTFLYAVREAMRAAGGKSVRPFIYNGKQYRLESEKRSDAKAGQQFAARKLASAGAAVVRLTGTIHNVETRENTGFRLWFEAGEEMPIRFEYKARSFLLLSFEWARG